ncbi:glycosyltransferase family 2 protein [Spirosoma rhododendri]|uniref:Glycosyltransferase family 2 protein n=1 Tax=Spirosoma rhododendri TaxID=2728024 RepID=A0A7L5DI25_9BACT|nr:glycosyltransferase family 2 protein [Spirosoma rhododendri]QJD77022.1 glycosyltransferase family 2 protein [Spirosoma rhododendri]
MFILNLLLVVLLGYTGFVTVYLFIFAAAGRLRSRPAPLSPDATRIRRMAVLIPAYREDGVILESARQGLAQTYPTDAFDIIVIADSLQRSTVDALRQIPVQVVEVSFDQSTKAKALNAALQQLPDRYDVGVVLDADNLMAPDVLHQINAAFGQGWSVVQGHRVAKNTNTSVAVLDAISEEINNHIFRQGHRALGLSAALIGSGMAFDYSLLKDLMPSVQAVGGFDKEIEMRLLSRGVQFGYLPDALVYDEKVQSEAVFERQRTRWIAAQIKYLKLNAGPGIKALFTGNIDYADKVFQTVLPPRILLLGTLAMGALVGALFGSPILLVGAGGQLLLLLLTFYLSAPRELARKIGPAELLKLPLLFGRFIKSIYRMKTARNQFLHTPHGAEPVSKL